MSATNKTTNYELPLFVDNDQPTWLGDFNGAMNKIDATMAQTEVNANTAALKADAAKKAADDALSLAKTNEQDIADVDAQLAGTADSGLKDYMTKAVNAINEPANGFSIATGYDMQSRCQWKKFTFPKSTYPLNKLKIDLALEPNIPERNYYKWLTSKTEGVYFNGPLLGPTVSNGLVAYNSATPTPEYWYLLLVKDGVVSVRKDTTHTATAPDLVSEGYEFACCMWSPILLDGIKFDVSNIPSGDTNYNYILNRKHPRTLFAWDDDNWYVVVIEGRGYINLGANFDEMYNICNSLGLKNAVNMDGGHSTQVWSTAPTFNYVYQNHSTKPYGFASGNIFAFISAHE